MSEVETSPGTELVIPNGEIIPLDDPAKVAKAILTLRDLEYQIRQAKEELTQTLVQHSMEIGNKTITLAGGGQATIKGGSETIYDAEEIMADLREAGMSEERISEIVTETVTYKVKAVEAKRAAAANPEYARAIEEWTHIVPRRVTVEIK